MRWVLFCLVSPRCITSMWRAEFIWDYSNFQGYFHYLQVRLFWHWPLLERSAWGHSLVWPQPQLSSSKSLSSKLKPSKQLVRSINQSSKSACRHILKNTGANIWSYDHSVATFFMSVLRASSCTSRGGRWNSVDLLHSSASSPSRPDTPGQGTVRTKAGYFFPARKRKPETSLKIYLICIWQHSW